MSSGQTGRWALMDSNRPHCRIFHHWILTRSREQQAINDQMLGAG
jgi:LysR family glycine cleavage system transcriptional activator